MCIYMRQSTQLQIEHWHISNTAKKTLTHFKTLQKNTKIIFKNNGKRIVTHFKTLQRHDWHISKLCKENTNTLKNTAMRIVTHFKILQRENLHILKHCKENSDTFKNLSNQKSLLLKTRIEVSPVLHVCWPFETPPTLNMSSSQYYIWTIH